MARHFYSKDEVCLIILENSVEPNRTPVSAGTVVTVGLSILVGSFSLAIVGPNVEGLCSSTSPFHIF